MLYTIVAVLVLVLDQAVKFWTVKTIPPMAAGGDTVSLIPGVLHMTNVQNDGAAFSILADQRWLLVGVSALFIIGIIVLISMDIIHTKFGRWTAVLVMAGALGNCIDRVMYGYVVDMFEVELFNFAVFNIADIFITVCGILFCIHVIVYREPAEERNAVPRKDRGKVRQLVDERDDEPYDDGQSRRRSQRGAKGKGKDKGRGKKERPDPYADVPKRGEHRTLADEIRPQDPEDPFAEWDDEEEPPRQQIAGRRTKAPQPRQDTYYADEEPVRAPAPRRASAPADPWDELEMPVAELPARRPASGAQQRPASGGQRPAGAKRPAPNGQQRPAGAKRPAPSGQQRPASSGQRPAGAKRPAPNGQQRPAGAQQRPAKKPAPKKKAPSDAGFEDYSLEDILSEFRDI